MVSPGQWAARVAPLREPAGLSPPPPVHPVTPLEQLKHAAAEATRKEKMARAAADKRSNEMALRALEAERTKRLEAERRLEIERESGVQLRSRINTQDRRKVRRQRAATTIQAVWRGYWIRLCLHAGRAALAQQAIVMQAAWRQLKERKKTVTQDKRACRQRLLNEYLSYAASTRRLDEVCGFLCHEVAIPQNTVVSPTH